MLENLRLDSHFVAIPIRLRWHGWVTDSFTLRECGWEIKAAQNRSVHLDAAYLDIAAIPPDKKLMIYGRMVIDHLALYARSTEHLLRDLCDGGIEMSTYKTTDRVECFSWPTSQWKDLNTLEPFNGLGNFDLNQHTYNFLDSNLFKDNVVSKDIYIPQLSVDECLNQILKLQYPEQVQLKKASVGFVKPTIHAKIYSLAA